MRCVHLCHTLLVHVTWLSEQAFAILHKGSQRGSFRAYHALITFQSQLEKTSKNGTMRKRLNHYNHASRMAPVSVNINTQSRRRTIGR